MNIKKFYSQLEKILLQMYEKYIEDKQVAIRGQYFIRLLHQFCEEQLITCGIPKNYIKKEFQLYGCYKTKKIDVGVVHPQAGPLIIITIRSQMSSIAKNIDTNFEGLIGDATNLHDKYPTLVLAHLLLWPKIGFVKYENPPFDKVIPLLEQITNRKTSIDHSGRYEHIAFIVVDFNKKPPEVLQDIPNKNSILRIENFFEKIYFTFKERNRFIKFK